MMNAGRMEQFGTPEEVYKPSGDHFASFHGLASADELQGRTCPTLTAASQAPSWEFARAPAGRRHRLESGNDTVECWAPSARCTAAWATSS
jgi:ABC-type Fe3+/spermidine/putrescine transport system ATPase subunit